MHGGGSNPSAPLSSQALKQSIDSKMRAKAVSILPPLHASQPPPASNSLPQSRHHRNGSGGSDLSGAAGGGAHASASSASSSNAANAANPFAPQPPVKSNSASNLFAGGGSSGAAGGGGGGVGRLHIPVSAAPEPFDPFAPQQPSASGSSGGAAATGRRPNLNLTDPNPFAPSAPASSSSAAAAAAAAAKRHPPSLPSLQLAVESGGDDNRAHQPKPNLNLTDPNPFISPPQNKRTILNSRRPLGATTLSQSAAAAAPPPAITSAPAQMTHSIIVTAPKVQLPVSSPPPPQPIAAAPAAVTVTASPFAPERERPPRANNPAPAPAASSGSGFASVAFVDENAPDIEILPVLTEDGLVLPDGEPAALPSAGRQSGVNNLALPRSGDRGSGTMAMINPHLQLALGASPLSGAPDEEQQAIAAAADSAPTLVLTSDGLIDPRTGRGADMDVKQPSVGLKLSLGTTPTVAPVFVAPPNDLLSPSTTYAPPAPPEAVVTPQSITVEGDIPVLTDDGLVTKSGALIDSNADLNAGRGNSAVPFGLKLAIPPPAQPYRNVISNTDPKRASMMMSNRRASMLSQNGKAAVPGTGGAAGLQAVMAGLAAAAAAGNIGPSTNNSSAPPPPFGLGGMKLKIDIKAEVNPNARKEGLAETGAGADGTWAEPEADHEPLAQMGGNELRPPGTHGGAHSNKKDRYATFVVTKDNTFVSRGFKIDDHGVHMTPDRKAKELARKKNPLMMNPDDPMDGLEETMSDTVGMEISHSDLIQISVLGRGQNGNVYKSLHMTTFTLVALKTVNAMERSTRHQLVKELSTFCQINNPHLVRLLGAYFHEGEIFMALECMNAGSLKQWVEHHGPVTDDRLLKSFTRQMVLGIQHLHKHMQLHNDIKPDNVLLNKAGVVKLCDFGLVKQFDRNSDKCLQFLGTTVYLSPERITSQEFSYSSDIWSLGLTVMYCALGQLPWEKDSDYWSLISQITKKSPTLPKDKYPPDLCDFIDKCLMQDPNARYSATQLLSHPYLAGVNTIAPIYQDTRAGVEELEEIMDAAVLKIRSEPKNFKELSGQLGLQESVTREAWTRHKAALEAERERLENPTGGGMRSSRVQLSASRQRRQNNFMEPETPTGVSAAAALVQSINRASSNATPTAATPTPTAASGSATPLFTPSPHRPPDGVPTSIGSPPLGRPNTNPGGATSASPAASPPTGTTAAAAAAAGGRDRSVSAPAKPLDRIGSARRRQNFRLGDVATTSSPVTDKTSLGSTSSPFSPGVSTTADDGDIQILDSEHGSGAARESPVPSGVAAAAPHLVSATPTGNGTAAASTGASGLPPRASSLLLPGSSASSNAHKHKFKPVQKLGLMSPREQLATADKVPIVAASPRFARIHTPVLNTGAAPLSPPTPNQPALSTAASSAAAGVPNVSLTLSAAAAAASSHNALQAQKAQEKRRTLALQRRRGTGAGDLSPNSGKNSGDAVSITAAVVAANRSAGVTSPFHDIDPLTYQNKQRAASAASTASNAAAGSVVSPVPTRPSPAASPRASPVMSGTAVGAANPNATPPTANGTALKPTRPSIPKPAGTGAGPAVPPSSAPAAIHTSNSTSSPTTPVLGATKTGSGHNIFSDPIFQLASSSAISGAAGAGASGGSNAAAGAAGGVSLRNKKLLAAGGAVRKNHRRSRSNPSNLYEEAIAATGTTGTGTAAAAPASATASASASTTAPTASAARS